MRKPGSMLERLVDLGFADKIMFAQG